MIYNTKRASCGLCDFWDNSASSGASEEETGQCRRSTPGFDSRTGLAVWPFVEVGDWCGEFVLNEDRKALEDAENADV